MEELKDMEFDVDLSEFAAQDGNQTEETQEEETGGEGQVQEEAEQTEDPGPEDGGEQEKPDAEEPEQELFDLKYQKNHYRVSRERVTELAQKGMHYDTLKQRLDEAEGFRGQYEDLRNQLEAAAKESGTDVAGLLDGFRLAQYRKNGATENEARAKLEAEKLRKQLEKSAGTEKQGATDRRAATREKAQRDLEQFVQLYGDRRDIDLRNLPKEVLEQAQETNLVEAFSRYEAKKLAQENEKLKHQLEAEKKNKENRKSAPKSVESDAGDGGTDAFLAAFLSDD